MTRSELIDYIEDNYNQFPDYDRLYNKMFEMFGDVDDTGEDGIYTNLSDQDLEALKEAMDGIEGVERTYKFTDDEIDVVRKAMEDFSDPAFTKDFDMSRIARNILRKIPR